MDKKHFTEKILRLTMEVIQLLTGEEYIAVKKSSGWSRTQDPIMDPTLPTIKVETKNMKNILQVANDIIHLLTGEVLCCLEDHKDPCVDVIIVDPQSSALQDTSWNRNKLEVMHFQITQPHVQRETECSKDYQGSELREHEGPERQRDIFPDMESGDFQANESLGSCDPAFCDLGVGAADDDDHKNLQYAVFQVKEEPEPREDGEGYEQDDHGEASTQDEISQCQPYENESQTFSEDSLGQSNPMSSPTIPNAKTYECPDCTEVFSCRSDLLKHQSHHRGSPLFTCLLCEKKFTSKSNLAKHQKIHTGEKPYSCPECGKHFRERHYLASHQAVHRGTQLILCPQCGKGYTSKSNLAKHQRIHTGQKPFGCSICNKSFNQRSVLIVHQRTHTGEKPFSCDLCTRRFTDKQQLARHQATHIENKLFCCNECGKSFTRKDLLIKHLAAHSVDGLLD